MSDLVAEAIREVTTATRRVTAESSRVAVTRVFRDGDHVSFALPETLPLEGAGIGLKIYQLATKIASKQAK